MNFSVLKLSHIEVFDSQTIKITYNTLHYKGHYTLHTHLLHWVFVKCVFFWSPPPQVAYVNLTLDFH